MEADGHWAMFHIGNWQHALMYSGFAVSGVVDLIGYYSPLPAGVEQVRCLRRAHRAGGGVALQGGRVTVLSMPCEAWWT